MVFAANSDARQETGGMDRPNHKCRGKPLCSLTIPKTGTRHFEADLALLMQYKGHYRTVILA